ncbi:hypothetical protein FA13DRAFT_472139 [Coprinellus micaceus]|uniref:Ubiquitin-like domain-containing protein n=1 Tax=Coprinellus micaceus TaxID=71717 RepID=A0A4Y7TAL2_COPMI|nr:hypothetical protein FA13DRAFT_472139 [Coprinellus micaceus]
MSSSSRRTAHKTKSRVQRSRQTRRPSPGHGIDHPRASTAVEGPSFSFPPTEASTSISIAPPSSIKQLASTKRRLLSGASDALDKGSKRPRLHSPTPPILRNEQGHSGWPPPSRRVTTNTPPAPLLLNDPETCFGEDIDDHDGDTNAAGSQSLRNVTTSFTSRVTSTSMPTNLAGPSQAVQHLFTNASNFSIGQFNSHIVSSIDNQQIQLLVQLLQSNLAQRSLSQSVGYTRENGVRIVDALGGELILPPSIMRHYSDIHELMLKHFHGKLGEEHVVKNRYCIVTERDGTLVQPENWDRVLSSNEGLTMCMTVEKVLVTSVKDTCPQCGKTRLGTYRDGGWLICRRCEKRFKSSTNSTYKTGKPPIHDKEISSFRHIHKVFVIEADPSR